MFTLDQAQALCGAASYRKCRIFRWLFDRRNSRIRRAANG
jgi:hypothetical protein